VRERERERGNHVSHENRYSGIFDLQCWFFRREKNQSTQRKALRARQEPTTNTT